MDTKKCKEISFLLRFLFLCPESEFFNDDVCKVEILPVNRTSCAKLTFSAFQQTLVVDRIPIFSGATCGATRDSRSCIERMPRS